METTAVLPEPLQARNVPPTRLLIADDDARVRALVSSRARDAVEALAVVEAGDGAEAIRVALQQRPDIALLDVGMPRLGGIEVALMLRELLPELRLALQTADPFAHRDRARRLRLPLFDKLELDRTLGWLGGHVRAVAPPRPRLNLVEEAPSLECSGCGYGIVRSAPPERCPMCQSDALWLHAARRPLGHRRELTW